ncbi:MAG: DUF3841 domain-containing protein [Synergistaceae bacterium]|nr:DUF3841 domain-containing protein [Synergistaceae bacterium]MBQ6114983.1 DUF3841 domain-containing protein [Synergistaceae bacterium]MBQ6982920.1 DUF3841 domain-containing protein [Synergistaceae bacterium]
MILWTIQPDTVFKLIYTRGHYRCSPKRTCMLDFAEAQYEWLVFQMKKRIGPPPEGVNYPVWAWYRWSITKKRPDLRGIRWWWGQKGDKFYRLEIDIPDSDVLLSDYEGWAGIILNNCLLSDTEQENNELEKFYASLNSEEQKKFLAKNWERVFDITQFNNRWSRRGETVQATFWELKKEQVRSYTSFITEGKR